jgi:pimeloyl-ACP methyl ester carboxylesterase
MSTYVLIHGAWHGAWCWHKLMPLLESHGHRVIAPDLPSHGIDRTPTASVSLRSYTDAVVALLDAAAEPVHLVGHSMGGLVITQAAEVRPEKVATLVYLAAFLLPNGTTLLERAQADSGEIIPNLEFAPDHVSACIRQEALRGAAYADCSAADIALARSLLVPQAALPLMTPIETTPQGWGRVPRMYIECTEDRAITIGLQRAMQAELPCRQVITMATSHSPFLSAPRELAEHLLAL